MKKIKLQFMWLYIYYQHKDGSWIFDRSMPIEREFEAKRRLQEMSNKFGRAGVYTPELIPGAFY